ncbi:hypothetical protein METBIDRAFT_230377 [Metschnikowia bicuspidata var. bicuspidata NRRL YB-4993]|uniref:Uncharacterized protein n=1 Tax=Metschnikowia bicuspidata var. bicuspidata NRRL YB-4993 TaxID=869754 RepID=A0A1A0H778_9ASCO|nr:hypothetical protein METBIDRAFT_230377 [Metschnikowia bicuspidata var. bicuspidata NRRL YB-4993]OBA19752.1 hypothetical protein METBIDRAFT_230377 [Metschnikowia bicuspidata var. bicuspidata NRRL YB-4993]
MLRNRIESKPGKAYHVKHTEVSGLCKSIIDRITKIKFVKESPVISQALARLTDLVLKELIDLWFSKISVDLLFQDSLRLELKHVFSSLSARIAAVDVPNVLVHKITPLLTDHYAQFISTDYAHDSVHSFESKLNVARKFGKGSIHNGVTMTVPGSGPRIKEKAYLRTKVKKLLPLLLSPQESSNELVGTLLTEILACTVLTNAFSVLSEGDFFNQMVVKAVGANLKHRNQVKRLREALQQHTTQTPTHTLRIGQNSALPPLKAPISPEYKSLKFQTLDTVLAEPKHAAVFREFLRGYKHEAEIDLWQHIELMRAPLEGTDTSGIPLFLEFSNEDDIVKIYEKYFALPFLEISELIRRQVSAYVQNATRRDAALYQQARLALFELQNDIFAHMKAAHLEQFRSSNRFGDLEAVLPKKSINPRVISTAFPRTTNVNDEDKSNTEIDQEKSPILSPVVVQAVESAFEKIMKTTSIDHENRLLTPTDCPDSTITVSRKSSQPSLFGDTTELLDNSVFGSNPYNSNRLSALFEETSDSDLDSNSLSDSVDSSISASQSFSNLELLLAAPGDLSLAEKIGVLDQDIENLTKQNDILLSLLKKAELTNNVAELKVLRRSNASLEKEINTKELQKQQYIVQENDNSLYGKSKIRIQSCVFGKDEKISYVMYVIEVQKYSSEDPNEIVAGWIVARRFSQFHKLHEFLKRRYNDVNEVKFPKKNVPYLKFQKTQQIETRKPILEKYLQDLLAIPDVCSDPAFRSFLSSETFKVGKSQATSKSTFYSMFNRFPRELGNDLRFDTSQVRQNKEMLQNIKEMERELKQYDEIQKNSAEKVPFVKPISDLLLTLFDLSKSNWLRGRALLVILQQVLGSTIERTLTSQIEQNIKQDLRIADVLNSLQDMLFPNGKFRESPELRTKAQQLATRKEANSILQIYMSETCSKIFGIRNTDQACKNILEMFQNDYLNKHLMFNVLDVVLLAIFPELDEDSYKV